MSLTSFRWPDFVHASAGDDAAERSRHGHFIVTRLIVGAAGLACLPPYLAWRGAPSPMDSVLALALAGPVFAAAIASVTGRLAAATAVSAASSAGLVCCLAGSGGPLWPLVVCLLLAPLDSCLAGSARSAWHAGAIGLAALLLLVVAIEAGVGTAESASPASMAAAFLAITALIQLAGHALRHGRRDRVDRNAASTRAIEDRSLLLAIGDLVTWHDRAGEVLEASACAGRFIGASAAALRGNGLIQHVHVSDRPAYLRALSDAANGHDPVTVEVRLHLGAVAEPDGALGGRARSRVTWVEMRARKVEASGTDIAVVSVIRDMSAQRGHAEELEKARLEAERANELKGRFLATVSHELRTPLNAIIGFSELLTADHPYVLSDERRKEYANIIRTSGHHLLEVVNTLLDMSKIETGNVAFEPEPFSLAELTDGCCDLLQLKADEAGVSLRRPTARDVPEITADRRACRQILINLLSNAVKFTPASGSVSVSIQRDRDRVVLAVSDTGIGIGEGDLPRLGDPFFQAGDAYRRPHEGTGLGLSVVRGLVGLHHGSLSIESAPGAGTTVTVSLPLDCRSVSLGVKPVTVRTLVRPTGHLDRKSA